MRVLSSCKLDIKSSDSQAEDRYEHCTLNVIISCICICALSNDDSELSNFGWLIRKWLGRCIWKKYKLNLASSKVLELNSRQSTATNKKRMMKKASVKRCLVVNYIKAKNTAWLKRWLFSTTTTTTKRNFKNESSFMVLTLVLEQSFVKRWSSFLIIKFASKF